MTVTATFVSPSGTRHVGRNDCRNPQKLCPREQHGFGPGKGYFLCKEICDQPYHAEKAAIFAAAADGAKIEGGHVYVSHTWICDDCKAFLDSHKITYSTGEPPC